MDYIKQAEDFLTKTGASIEIQYIGHGKHFEDDKRTRDIYRFTLRNKGREYSGNFGQSIVNSGTATQMTSYDKNNKILGKRKKPSAYDIIAGLTKYEAGDFDNFCAEYGYDTDSRKAERIYFAVQKEYRGVCSIWDAEEREELAEIQ